MQNKTQTVVHDQFAGAEAAFSAAVEGPDNAHFIGVPWQHHSLFSPDSYFVHSLAESTKIGSGDTANYTHLLILAENNLGEQNFHRALDLRNFGQPHQDNYAQIVPLKFEDRDLDQREIGGHLQYSVASVYNTPGWGPNGRISNLSPLVSSVRVYLCLHEETYVDYRAMQDLMI